MSEIKEEADVDDSQEEGQEETRETKTGVVNQGAKKVGFALDEEEEILKEYL